MPVGKVAVDAVDHHSTLVRVMGRPNPGLRGVRMDVARLVAEFVSRCGLHADLAAHKNGGADANSNSDKKWAFMS